MSGKIFRSIFYAAIIVALMWSSVFAEEKYGDVEVYVSCGSRPVQGMYVMLSTPSDQDGSAMIAVKTDQWGIATFVMIEPVTWDVYVDHTYVDTVQVVDEHVVMLPFERCNGRLYLPIVAK